MALMMSGCSVDGQSTEGGHYKTVDTPTGTVQGVLVDNNGNPMSDVTVGLMGKSTTTDATGQYVFTDVAVTNVAGADAGTGHAPLAITVAAPTGYLGAIINVTPAAQIDSGADDGNGTTVTNPNTTFIDGFTASAGTTVLPQLGATVTGHIEHNTTQEALANVNVFFDTPTLSVPNANGTAVVVYGSNTDWTATTTTDGAYTITDLPEDMNFVVRVVNHTGNCAVNTNIEVGTKVPTCGVLPISYSDQANPYITNIYNSTTDGNADTGYQANGNLLAQGNEGGFTVRFSETIDTSNIASDSIKIYVANAKTDYTGPVGTAAGIATELTGFTTSWDSTNTKLTIDLGSTVSEDTDIDVWFDKSVFVDTAGNILVSNSGVTNLADGNSTHASYVLLELETWNVTSGSAITVDTLAQMANDGVDEPNGYMAALEEAVPAFTSVDGNVTTAAGDVNDQNAYDIYQMNAEARGTTGIGITADNAIDDKLVNYGRAALGSTLNITNQLDVNNTAARVSFTPNGATSYRFYVMNSSLATTCSAGTNGNLVALTDLNQSSPAFYKGLASAPVVTSAATNGVQTLTPSSSATSIELLANGVLPGDVVCVESGDELGYYSAAAPVTLVDNVGPTTVLQRSYLANTATTNTAGNAANTTVGDGGQLYATTSGTTVSVGIPYLDITPGLIDSNRNSTWNEVTTGNSSKLEDLNNSGAVITATAWANFYKDANLTRDVGVAFSEDISVNGTPDFSTAANVDTSVIYAVNDITTNSLYGDADIVYFRSSNVIDMANEDTGLVFDFSNKVYDAASNAGTVAKVVTRDKMPPFVTKAYYSETPSSTLTGEGSVSIAKMMTLVFNEAITMPSASTQDVNLSIFTQDGSERINLTKDSNFTLSSDSKTLTVYLNGLTVGNSANDFNGSYFLRYNAADRNYTAKLGTFADTAVTTGTLAHVEINSTNIPDANGNRWDDWNSSRIASTIHAPTFSAVDTSELIITSAIFDTNVTSTRSGYLDMDSNSSHRFDLNISFNKDIARMLDYNETAGYAYSSSRWMTNGRTASGAGLGGSVANNDQNLSIFFELYDDAVAGDVRFVACNTFGEGNRSICQVSGNKINVHLNLNLANAAIPVVATANRTHEYNISAIRINVTSNLDDNTSDYSAKSWKFGFSGTTPSLTISEQ